MAIDQESIAQLITTVGFPIVAYLLIYWDMRRKLEDGFADLKEAINDLKEKIS